MLALTESGDVIRTTNAGAAWSAIGAISQVGMRDCAYVGSKLKAISRQGEIAESATGATWTWIGSALSKSADGLAMSGRGFRGAFAPGAPEFLTGVESAGAEARPFALEAYPNPFRDRVRLRLTTTGSAATESPVPTTFEIYDLAGRLVASVDARAGGARQPDASSAEWDGRLSDGRPAPSGIFLVLARTGAATCSERVTLLR